jgi:hypothetical protein
MEKVTGIPTAGPPKILPSTFALSSQLAAPVSLNLEPVAQRVAGIPPKEVIEYPPEETSLLLRVMVASPTVPDTVACTISIISSAGVRFPAV